MFPEHSTGWPAGPHCHGRPDDALLDPLLLGLLTTAWEDESADAYQQGFRDGLRAAAPAPGDQTGEADDDDPLAADSGSGEWGSSEWGSSEWGSGEWGSGDRGLGEGDWQW